MADNLHPKFGNVVAIPFTVSNIATNATNTDVALASGINTGFVAPNSGSVVGLSVKGNANCTAGAVTWKAHIASTEFTASGAIAPVINATNSNATYASVRPGVMTFAAGDTVGVSYSSATDYAAVTIDYDAVLFVVLNPD